MRIECYIQARMGSTRLPGKVLKPILSKPMLGYMLERVQRVRNSDACVVLTSTSALDDSIAAFCEQQKVACFRGSEDNVLDRYYQAALKRKPDAIVRLTADCPLIDPDVVNEVIETYKKNAPNYDYVSNSLERTFPRGLDTEIFSMAALQKAVNAKPSKEELEHVTLCMYRHPELFKLKNFACKADLSKQRWTVDTPEDFELVKRIIEALYPHNPRFTMQDVLNVLKQHPEWEKLNAHVEQKKIITTKS